MTDDRAIDGLADQIIALGQSSNISVGLHQVAVVTAGGAKGGVDPAVSVLIGSKNIPRPRWLPTRRPLSATRCVFWSWTTRRRSSAKSSADPMSEYRCRVHPDVSVTPRGSGCPWCDTERMQRRQREAEHRRDCATQRTERRQREEAP
jgi:hypothetical protein